MAEYSVGEIAAACNGKLLAVNEKAVIRHLVIDSRKFSFPRDSVFFAITGVRHDGHNYLEEMYSQQVRNFVVSWLPEDMSGFALANFIIVDNTLLALQQVSAMHRSAFKLPVIGITGSNGKTILKEWLYQLLHKDKIVIRSPKSYNSQVGVPLSVWQIKPHHELAVFEAGISKPGEMEYLEEIIKPEIGVITNIGQAHQEHFTSLKEKLTQKLILFKNAKTLVYCADHKLIADRIKNDNDFSDTKLFTWSLSVPSDLNITGIIRKTNISVLHGIFKDKACSIRIPFTDQASVENAIHAWAVLLLLGYSEDYISDNMKRLSQVAMRMEQKRGINNCVVINDSYNSDPVSLAIALDYLSSQIRYNKKTLILSDMFETGKDIDELYRETGELLLREKIDRLIGIGKDILNIKKYFTGKSEFFLTTGDFTEWFKPENFYNESILLKGARDFGFERISMLLEEKSHATVMEINLNNLIQNYNYFKALINKNTKIMAVVKAFSYGSGSYEIANILAYNLVDYLAVAFFDEGVILRKAGIKVPVMVMNPDFGSYSMMPEHELEPEIYNLRGLKLFIEILKKRDIKNYPVHIKLDTGMYRLGFSEQELPELAGILSTAECIYVKSVFSHLAAGDEPAHDDFTLEQIQLFSRMADEVCSGLNYRVLRHILNSAGIERFPWAQFDMVRLGIGLYGISAIENNRLANVNTFRSIVSQIKEVPAGHTIGYSRAYKTINDTRIAIVPVGYADGLNRRLGNGNGRMIVNDISVPVVGNICMDMCMLDIGSLPVKEGDEVIIFGEENPISEIAGSLSTIPYEVFTNISSRVKRIYIKE